MRVPHEALRQRITIFDKQQGGSMGGGFAEGREVRANVQQTQNFSVEWKDEELIINTLVIIRPEAGPVAAGSRVTVGSNDFRVVKSFAIPDEFRPSHYELAVMSWGFEE